MALNAHDRRAKADTEIMCDNADSIVLEHLRHIHATVDRTEARLDDLTARVGHLETNIAHVQVSRLTRIEKRLDLAEA